MSVLLISSPARPFRWHSLERSHSPGPVHGRSPGRRAGAGWAFYCRIKVPTHVEPAEARTTSGVEPTAPKGRVTEPVPGLYDSIDPKTPPAGWKFTDQTRNSPRGIQITTEVTSPDGKSGWIQRTYDSKTKTLIMENAFLQDLPSWIEVGVPMVKGKGTPTVTYLTLRQLKSTGVGIGELKKIKMSTIQNVEAILELNQFVKNGVEIDEAVARTHSVRYATTSIEQSGHQIASVHLDRGGAWEKPVGFLMEHYETGGGQHIPTPEVVQRHEALLTKYGAKRADVMLMNYDILIDVSPHPANP